MEIFIFIVGILLFLGFSDLIVGVSNDAVNFTNSAFGSKAGSRRAIILIASIGILLGALSSSGMMEVARKGIFNPAGYTLEELMFLFVAVMLSDIILLDLYNTLGLPTSTTVSLVFELFGAALALALIKTQSFSGAFELINAQGAIKIGSGIVLSIFVAFFSGMIIQFFFRTLFTFNYQRYMNHFGGIFGGLALTIITFFVIFKGLKNTAFLNASTKQFIDANMQTIILVSFACWTLLFQMLIKMRVNVLKIIILVGTGALAMAFAGNDLVNFIGVPIAGLNTYQLIDQAGGMATQSGAALAGSVPTQSFLLLAAAGIMIATLWLSKKARTVSKTELTLGSQGKTMELFSGDNAAARVFVQIFLSIHQQFLRIAPKSLLDFLSSRFDQSQSIVQLQDSEGAQSFDLLRASVNIVTASVLIMFATSLKLPLSTTYVTFMVSMGSSLSDKAWGRDNAVSRVAGVFTVIGGWFMTAVIAAMTAGLLVSLIYTFGFVVILLLVFLAFYLIYAFHHLHKKRDLEFNARMEEYIYNLENPDRFIKSSFDKIAKIFSFISSGFLCIFEALIKNRFEDIRKAKKGIKENLAANDNSMKEIIEFASQHLTEEEEQYLPYLTRTHSAIESLLESLSKIRSISLEKISSSHKSIFRECEHDIEEYINTIAEIFAIYSQPLAEQLGNIKMIPSMLKKANRLKEKINKGQFKKLKKRKIKTGSSISLFIILEELSFMNHIIMEYNDNLKKLRPLIRKSDLS